MKKEENFTELRDIMQENPLIIVGVTNIEGEEICKFLSKEEKTYKKLKLSPEAPFWEEVSDSVKDEVKSAINAGRKVVCFCIKGNLPEEVFAVSSYWHGGGEDNISFSPLEQLSIALKKDVSPYHRLIAANGKGFIYAMREEAERILKGFGAKSRFKSILKEAGVSEFDLEDYRQKVYDAEEAGMGGIPESYRAGVGLVIREIRKKDRLAQGITPEQEKQAERVVMRSYLIGSVTVVDMHEAKPASVFDRLIEAERYGLLMLSAGGESYFVGPWKKVKKFESHFMEGEIGGEPNVRGHWKGKYSRPLVLDFVKSMEKVKDKANQDNKSTLFMS